MVPLLLLLACAPGVERFQSTYARLRCMRLEQCALGEFEDRYDGDDEECRLDFEDRIERYARCDFDSARARRCHAQSITASWCRTRALSTAIRRGR
jgi:hypothetical protein